MMEENTCDIARDLMPLELDGVCSPGSQTFLKKHLQSCPPCQTLYHQMKSESSALKNSISSDTESLALAKGMKRAGRRMTRLKRGLILCCALMLLIAGIASFQAMRWNRVAKAPLDLYELSLTRFDDCVQLDLTYSFTNLRSVLHEVRADASETSAGTLESVVVTYYVEYYPIRAEAEKMISPSSNHLVISVTDFCIKDDLLYTVDRQTLIPLNNAVSLPSAPDAPTLYLVPDLPVSEIRVTDGRQTRVLYTLGDTLPEKDPLPQAKSSKSAE